MATQSVRVWSGEVPISRTSPGSLSPNRLALANPSQVYVASANTLYSVQVTYPQDYSFVASKLGSTLPLPSPLPPCSVTPLNQSPQGHEIQHVHFDHNTSRLFSTDAKGNIQINSVVAADGVVKVVKTDNILNNDPSNRTELGWAGLALDPHDPNKFISGQQFGGLTLYNNGIPSSRIYCTQPVNQMAYAGDGSVVCALETNSMAVYDLKSNTCIKRLSPGNSLYAIDSKEWVIGVGGAARNAWVFDTRKWTVSSCWVNALKYEMTSFHFSGLHDSLCYVSGMDSELVCGDWVGNTDCGRHFTGFRCGSRWQGLALEKGTDTIVAVNESMRLYSIVNPHLMSNTDLSKLQFSFSKNTKSDSLHTKKKAKHNRDAEQQ